LATTETNRGNEENGKNELVEFHKGSADSAQFYQPQGQGQRVTRLIF
jgi:hypothetical protein